MFGGRLSKGTGAFINTWRAPLVTQHGLVDGVAKFLTFSSMISFGCIGVWLLVAIYVAKTYDVAIKEKRIVC